MLKRFALLPVLALAIAACGSESVVTIATPTPSIVDELAATGVGEFIGEIEPDSSRTNGEWTEYLYDTAKEEAICLGGTQYQVNVHTGTSNKVLVYLEGGGACWNSLTCWVAETAKLEAGSASSEGILDLTDAENPFHDWNIIYVPYCDGSVFSGNNVLDYADHDGPTYHHGLQNISAALTIAQSEFPNPDMIVVSGSSAGGYGTLNGYGVTRLAYQTTPIIVFNDSGPGLQNPDQTDANQERADNWQYTQYIPPSCSNCTEQTAYLADWAMDRDPDLRAALFSYNHDTVIPLFLNLDAASFESLLLQVSGDIHSSHPDRFKRFIKAGAAHTVLELPDFYTLAIGETTIRDWTEAFLTDSADWVDIVEAAE
jgi:hypothetical protein